MAKFELKLPEMGEGIKEVTIIRWEKSVGDFIETEDTVVEVATDKVDSEVPSPKSGTLLKILFPENSTAQIGQSIAIIETSENVNIADSPENTFDENIKKEIQDFVMDLENNIKTKPEKPTFHFKGNKNFYSPLIKSIATKENITQEVLEKIQGTGFKGRITKKDLLNYIAQKNKMQKTAHKKIPPPKKTFKQNLELEQGDELMTLSRMGQIISQHMLYSQNKAVHVQSIIDVDVTELAKWRAAHKNLFLEKTEQKLTFTPIFMMAVARAIEKFPLVNIAFNGEDKVAIKKEINIGMATALPNGNLIVPVIKNAEKLNITKMATKVNDLAFRAKNNQLQPEEIQKGTYTVTNVGAFGTLIGTPIINQPQSAILALGSIRKMPCVKKDENAKDTIVIRDVMYITHAYDHRVINGALGGQFIFYIKQILEDWENFENTF